MLDRGSWAQPTRRRLLPMHRSMGGRRPEPDQPAAEAAGRTQRRRNPQTEDHEMETKDLIARLAALYPAAFFLVGADRKPLKLALALYTGSLGYLGNMREGVPRIGLDGQPAGAVTAEEELEAVARVLKIEAENAARWQRARERKIKPRLKTSLVSQRCETDPINIEVQPGPRNEPVSPAEVAPAVPKTTTSIVIEPSPAPSTPKRVGLSGLKAAWHARQATKEAAE